MIDIPHEIISRFNTRLAREPIPEELHFFYRRWLRFYFDFCNKYQHDAFSRKSLPPFLEKLAEKKQPIQLQKQAAHAVSFIYNDPGVPPVPVPQAQNCCPSNLEAQPASNTGRQSPASNEATTSKTILQGPKLTNADWGAAYAALKSEVAIRHYSTKTLRAYTSWMRHLQAFTKSKDTGLLTPADVKDFLTFLAVHAKSRLLPKTRHSTPCSSFSGMS